jgi:hypothetical protein
MPVSKSITTDYSVDATYWKITRIEADLRAMSIRYTFSGYPDADAAQSADQPLRTEVLTHPIDPDDLTTLATVVGIGETHAKESGVLQGATDAI